MLINLFVGQQVCKQSHTRRTRVTVVHLLIADRFLCTVQPRTNQIQIVEAAPRLTINSSSISHPPSTMSLRTEICQQLDVTVIIAGRLILIVGRIFTGISQIMK